MSGSNYDPSLALFYLRRIFSQDRGGESPVVSSIKYTIKHNLPYSILVDLEFVRNLPITIDMLLEWQYYALLSYGIDVERYFDDFEYRNSISMDYDPDYLEHCERTSLYAVRGIKVKKDNDYKNSLEDNCMRKKLVV